MPHNERFGRVLRRHTGDIREKEISQRVGLSQPYVNQILNGRVPPEGTLLKLAERLQMGADARREVLIAAGYLDWDPYLAYHDGLMEIADRVGVMPDVSLRMPDGLAGLLPDEVDVLLAATEERLAAEARRRPAPEPDELVAKVRRAVREELGMIIADPPYGGMASPRPTGQDAAGMQDAAAGMIALLNGLREMQARYPASKVPIPRVSPAEGVLTVDHARAILALLESSLQANEEAVGSIETEGGGRRQ